MLSGKYTHSPVFIAWPPNLRACSILPRQYLGRYFEDTDVCYIRCAHIKSMTRSHFQMQEAARLETYLGTSVHTHEAAAASADPSFFVPRLRERRSYTRTMAQNTEARRRFARVTQGLLTCRPCLTWQKQSVPNLAHHPSAFASSWSGSCRCAFWGETRNLHTRNLLRCILDMPDARLGLKRPFRFF